jgi:hypothetical protein
MNGAPRRLSLFCFAKKVTKKGEPAALHFVFVFLSLLFLLPPLFIEPVAARKLAVTFN